MRLKNQSFFQSFTHALNGMYQFFLHERNGRTEAVLAIIAIFFSIGMGVSNAEWIAVFLCIALVIGFEMLNSAIEKLCDMVQEEYHPVIKIIKDMSAAAVMWTSFISLIIAALIFIPKIYRLLC
jgi:undecaprenol kinase/diacylglycerol kinase (ATP)